MSNQPAHYTQDNRPVRLHTSLGKDKLLLVAFSGREAVSELFEFQVEFVTPRSEALDFADLIGRPAMVELCHAEDDSGSPTPTRLFHGIIAQLGEIGRDQDFARYELTLVPRLWLLTRNSQCRIFHNKTVRQMIAEVLDDIPFEFRLRDQYQPHNYCVQYCESDFNFICRLMEEEGLFFYFEHGQAEHRLIISDSSPTVLPMPTAAEVSYDYVAGGTRQGPRIRDWRKFQSLRPSRFTLSDYSFESPGMEIAGVDSLRGAVEAGKMLHQLVVGGPTPRSRRLEVFEYPGGFAHRVDTVGRVGEDRVSEFRKLFTLNDRFAQLRSEQEAMRALWITGAGDAGHFRPGYRFQLKGHDNGDGDYFLTEVEHAVRLAEFRSQSVRADTPDPTPYVNHFRCIPASVPYRPLPQTPRPKAPGAQTATVVGVGETEIFTDKYGRVKVQFHWDRDGQRDPNSSCWVRVAQQWAGKGMGMITIPRVGQEVIVDFLDGDIQKPIIVGSVFNAEQIVPLDLPEGRKRTMLKSRTYQGESDAFHGIMFDDTKESELLRVRSQKDALYECKNNRTDTIPESASRYVGKSDFTIVGGIPGITEYEVGSDEQDSSSEGGSGSGGSSGTSAEYQAGGDEPQSSSEIGSGSGGSSGTAGEEVAVSPSDWNKISVKAPVTGIECKSNYGASLNLCVGAYTAYRYPINTSISIDPLGLANVFGLQWPAANMVAGLAGGLFGKTDFIYGQECKLHFGNKMDIQRVNGMELKAKGSPTVMTAVGVGAHVGGVLLSSILAATGKPNLTKYGRVGTDGLIGLIGWILGQMEQGDRASYAALAKALAAKRKAQRFAAVTSELMGTTVSIKDMALQVKTETERATKMTMLLAKTLAVLVVLGAAAAIVGASAAAGSGSGGSIEDDEPTEPQTDGGSDVQDDQGSGSGGAIGDNPTIVDHMEGTLNWSADSVDIEATDSDGLSLSSAYDATLDAVENLNLGGGKSLTAFAPDLKLDCGSKGSLALQTGMIGVSKISMTNTGIELACATGVTKIAISTTAITLQAGINKLTIGPTGISMSVGSSSFDVTALGADLVAPQININGTAGVAVSSLSVDIDMG